MAKHLFTSESVTKGHPDKICDQISDAVLDEIMKQDPMGRVACETSCTTGMIMVMGEISTSAKINVQEIVRNVVRDIGYDDSSKGFDANTCAVITAIGEQSGDIALGVNRSFELKEGDKDKYNLHGAGDQGMMFGFACDETPTFMPMPIYLANLLSLKLTEVRENGTLPYLRADGKTQVTVEYDENNVPRRIDTVVISSQHSEDIELSKIRADIVRHVIHPVLPEKLVDERTMLYVNPTGRFVTGGPQGDSGLTGRKIIVDTYGGYSRHGGGAFSGKDPTKVDRSAAYAARYVAKNIVAAGLAKSCEIQLAYAIGVAHPVSVMVETFNTGVIDDSVLSEIVTEQFDLRPAAIIEHLNLRRPIYRQIAAYGHMGREDLDLSWEKTDAVARLQEAAGIRHIVGE